MKFIELNRAEVSDGKTNGVIYIPMERIVKLEKNLHQFGSDQCEVIVFWFNGEKVCTEKIKGVETKHFAHLLGKQ